MIFKENIKLINSNIINLNLELTTKIEQLEVILNDSYNYDTTDNGSFTHTLKSGNTLSQQITFNKSFTKPPIVNVSTNASNFGGLSCEARNITTSGFTFYVPAVTGYNLNLTCTWNAVGKGN